MLGFPRWKIVSIWAIIVALVALAIPSLLPERMTDGWGRIPHPRINLGLDLAGGSYLLLEADTGDLVTTRLEQMRDQVSTALRAAPRIEMGDISTQGGRVSFLLRDPSQVDAARERLLPLLGTGAGLTGQREYDLQVVDTSRFVIVPTRAGIDAAVDTAMKTALEVIRIRLDALGTREPTILRQGASRIVVEVPGFQNPTALKELLGKTAKLEFKMVDDAADPALVAKNQPPIGDVILPYVEQNGPAGVPPTRVALRRETLISGDQLVTASQGFKPDTNAPIVNFTFDSQGGRKFAQFTQQNRGKRFAIILDGQVISAPAVNDPILGGQGYIEGNFTAASANQLAIELRSGKLPVALKVVEERTVGPDLGKDSIHAGVIASVIAAVAVIVFMLVTYGRFGLYADLAVVINIFVILGVLALLNGTLTLPGIAGFVLTIGTAVDANVLINERIREERRRGRSVLQAVDLGYKEASRTIFEANMTHAISGVIMFLLGSGPVKGFAVVLLIGICTSVFTAVLFTRMLVAGWLRRERPTSITI